MMSEVHAAAALSEPLIMPTPGGKQLEEQLECDYEDSLSTFGSFSGEDDEGTSSSNSKDEFVLRLDCKGVASVVATSLLAAGGVAASAAAMIAAPRSALVLLMGGVSVLNAPTMARRQFRIARGEAIQKSVNNIRKEIFALKEEIDFLTHSVDGLRGVFQGLVDVAQELHGIATAQGTSVEEAVDLMKENEAILSQTKENLRRTFVWIVAEVMLRSENGGSTKIDLNELPMLVLRLQMQLEPHGIKLDTEIFEAMMREDNGDVSNLLRFCAEMLFEKESNANGGDDSVQSELTFDLEAARETWEKKPHHRMTHVDRARMVNIDTERVCKGSVEAARGESVTLVPKKGDADGARRGKTIVNMKEVKRRQETAKKSPERPEASGAPAGRAMRSRRLSVEI